MKTKQIVVSILGCLLFCGLSTASEAPVKWAENGHYYEAVIDTPSMSWEEARDWAFEQSYTDESGQLYKGYLATITSAKESDFIASLPLNEVNYLLGGYQTPTTNETTAAEKQADWHWVTDEEWNYTNWRSGEPNNFFRWAGVTGAGRSEEYLQYFPSQPPPITMPYAGNTPAVWNDVYTGTFTDDDGEQFFGASRFIIEYELASEPDPGIQNPAEWLLVSMEGTNVTADWSLMPEAQSYTLYYAYADYKGDVDMETIDSINMGQVQSIFVANLPSGVIFYIAIMAHTDEGDVLSNIVKFIPFGGSIAYPETGELLMQLDDPDGIGDITVIGTRNADGSDDLISEIRASLIEEPFVLYLTDNKPVSYEQEDFTINFIYKADGAVSSEVVLNNSQARIKTSLSSNTIDCSQYKNIDEYLNTIDSTISDTSKTIFLNHQRTLAKLSFLRILFLQVSVESKYYQENIQKYFDRHGYRTTAEDFLKSDPKFKAYQTIDSGVKLIELTAPTKEEAYKDVKQGYLEDYNNQCDDTPAPQPLPNTPTEIAMAEIDFECPIPETSEATYYELRTDSSIKQFYNRNGWTNDPYNALVGPYQTFIKGDSGFYQSKQLCYSPNGYSHRTNWQISYSEDGKITTANEYLEDDSNGHQYWFSEVTGLLFRDELKDHNRTISLKRYYSNGSLLSDCVTGVSCTYYNEDGSRKE